MAKVKLSAERLKALWNEIKMAEKFNEEELLPCLQESLSRYVGDFRPVIGANWDIILNEVYPIIQNQLPSIFFRNPRAFLRPRNPTYIVKRRDPTTEKMEEVQLDSRKSAKTQEHILNYSLTQNGFKKEVRKVLLDALLFPYGVLWHGYKGDFGMTEEKSLVIRNEKVFVKRISPMHFIKDPAVTVSDFDEAEWCGRVIYMRLRDIVEDEKLDVDKKLLKGFAGFGNVVGTKTVRDENSTRTNGQDKVTIASRGKTLVSFSDPDFQKGDESKFVKVYEIFLRPTKKEKRDGSSGWILLLTEEQKKPLREHDWVIKAEGWPGKILEFNGLNDNMFGLNDVDTYKTIADQKNAIINLQLRNAQENTKVWVGINADGADEEDVTKVQQGQNTILVFKGDTAIGQRMMVASPGGSASSELYLIDGRIQKNLEDKSGVTDLKRGFLQSGEESAASVKLRAAGGSARPAYRQDIMSDFLKDSLLYQNQLNKQFIPFKEAVRIVGSLDLEWSENPTKEELQADVDVELDVISMLPENPEKELEELGKALALMIDGIRDPAIQQKLAMEGKMLNLSPIIEQMLTRLKIRDPEIFRNIKPEESQGYVSVAEIRAAKANVEAALGGSQEMPSPPAAGQDHVARVEVYTSILQLIQGLGESIASTILTQMVMLHQQLMEEEQSKEPQVGAAVNLSRPSIQTFGSSS